MLPKVDFFMESSVYFENSWTSEVRLLAWLESVWKESNPMSAMHPPTSLQHVYKDAFHGCTVMCFLFQSTWFLVTEPVVRRVMQSESSTNDTAFFFLHKIHTPLKWFPYWKKCTTKMQPIVSLSLCTLPRLYYFQKQERLWGGLEDRTVGGWRPGPFFSPLSCLRSGVGGPQNHQALFVF